VVLGLYCRTPFGQLHKSNHEIIALASRLGRTPAAVAMKACNFANLDPAQQARGITGLSNVSHGDRGLWKEFLADSDTIAEQIESVYSELFPQPDTQPDRAPIPTAQQSEYEQIIRARRLQGFFRRAVLATYNGACALTGLSIPSLLNASHIIPWAHAEGRRADPRNGICLNALHDRAFDRGLISFDEEFCLLVSPSAADPGVGGELSGFLTGYNGKRMSVPSRFAPDPMAMEYHRRNIFIAA